MVSLNPDTVIVAIEHQRALMLHDEMVVLNLDNEEYYVFNESAAAIWSHLQQPICLKTLLANTNYANEAELTAFLLDLVSAGLLMETDHLVIAREINLAVTVRPILTCMGGMKELVAMAGSAGGNEDGNLDPGIEGVEDNSISEDIQADSNVTFQEFLNDVGVGDDLTGRPED